MYRYEYAIKNGKFSWDLGCTLLQLKLLLATNHLFIYHTDINELIYDRV